MSILGSILGEELEGSVLGDDLDDDEVASILGAIARRRGKYRPGPGERRFNTQHRGMHPQHPHNHPGLDGAGMHKPSWRGRELAPGVNEPGEGVVPLPLTPVNAGGVWSVATTTGTITFQGQLQKPFKSKRLLATTQRVGASATALVLGQIFVGVDLNQATIQPADLEALGAPTAFDTGMSLMQAPPGVILQIIATLGGTPPTGTDSIFASLMFLGHIIH